MAIRKKHVDFSQNGETTPQEQQIIDIALESSVQPQQEYVIYKLVSNSRRGRLRIDGIDDVINPKTNKPERIRLISGISTIWFSEQQDMKLSESYISQNRRELVFDGRILRVPLWDTTAIEFLENSRHFIENPRRKTGSRHEFFKYDPQKQEKAALDKEMLELEMAMKAKDMEVPQMKKMASYLGIIFYDELGRPKTDDGIRKDLMLKAKRSPELFINALNSREVEVSYMVKKALLDAKIDLGKQPDSAYWAAGGFICKIPQGRKSNEYLTELAMTNSEEGKNFLNKLQENTN